MKAVAIKKGQSKEKVQTGSCLNTTPITDEWFSYSRRGELTDVYESTPHSGGYYHTTASYWATGTINSLSALNANSAALFPTIYYGASDGSGLDGEGRVTQVTAASGTNPVTAATYDTSGTAEPLGALTGVTFGSADSDSFTYDTNTGRMATYAFSVNSNTDAGTLTWNTNGTLQKMVINDQIPGTHDSQTCNYLYDDLQRLSSANCGALWTQSFTYDSFGNITKTGTSSFIPGYSATQNQFTSIPGVNVSYDRNGNLLTDNLNTYTWDPYFGNMLTVSTGSTTVIGTYDALGRLVENSAGGTNTEFIYGPTGAKLAKVNGQALIKAFIALPGGAKAMYNSTGLAYYRHSDWLGSSRLTSTQSRTLYSSSSYGPFGEQYATGGTADASFTGQDQDTVSSLYDFPVRRYSPSQGRWISPDPLGRGAVKMTNPQTWNRYTYVNNNPLRLIDPMGTEDVVCGESDGGDCGGDGGGGGGGDDSSGGGGDNSGGGGDNSGGGDDNSGDPGQTCDADCQLQQAEQNALDALTNPDCARVVDGNTGAASTALLQSINPSIGTDPSSPLYGSTDPIATITTGDLGPNTTVTNAGGTTITGTAAQTTPTPNDEMVNGVWTNLGMTSPSTITLNSNANGAFLNQGGFMGYSNQFAQAITILHELGHAAAYAGLPGNIQPDVGSGGTGDPAVLEIQDLYNSQQIADNCFPTGD